MENKPMQTSQIDFSPLGDKSVVYRLTHFNVKDPYTRIVIAICAIPLLIAYLAHIGVISKDYMILAPLSLIYLVAPVVFLAKSHYQSNSKAAFKGFAGVNNWYIYSPDSVIDLLPPSLVSLSSRWNEQQTQIINVDLLSHRFELMRLVATDRKENTKQVAFLVRYELPKPLSHIILDNKRMTAGFSDFGPGLVETKLEASFPDHFRLLHTPNDHINALSLLTPDVMQAIVTAPLNYEIEVAGKYLYFYSFWDDSGARGVHALFEVVERIAPEVVHKAKTARI